MLRNYVEYDEDGRIIGQWRVIPEIYEQNKATSNLMEGVSNPDDHYIKDGRITNRPKQQTKLTDTTLSNLPVPCTIYINDTPYECVSDTAELEFDQPTTYTIRVEAWPYQDWSTLYENQA